MYRTLGLVSLVALTLPLDAAAQTPYSSPDGLFTLQVPTGWSVDSDPSTHQITIRDGAVQAFVLVSQQNKTNAMTAQEVIDSTVTEFKGQCPTTRVDQTGALTLAGLPAKYSLLTCNDTKSPAVAEVDSVLTPKNLLISVTFISPLARYAESLPTLDALRDSLRLAGQPTHTSKPADQSALAMSELKRACSAGVYPPPVCARKIAILAGAGAAPPPPDSAADTYTDPQGRFTVRIPTGWSATAEGDNGTLGVQLRSGSSFINIMPATNAATPDDVLLHHEQQIATQSHSDRTPPFGSAGIVRLFGNELALSYDHFSATSPQGSTIESYVVGAGPLSGKGDLLLLLAASFSQDLPSRPGAIFLSTAQSIHLMH